MNPQQAQIDKLTADLAALNQEYYSNNFSAIQDFYKYSRFQTRLKVPHYASTPTVGDIGELVEVAGILYICTATTPTWTKVGTQS